MPRHTTLAIVVRTVDYGESDRVVTLLSRDRGKLSAIARGARKSRRRFGAGLGLFGIGEAGLSGRPGAELETLESFDVTRGFPHLPLDVAKLAHASYACELSRELVPPHQPEPALFDLLVALLAHLDAETPRAETLRVFELKVLETVGLRPALDRCGRCGDPAGLDEAGQVFDVRRGGVVCGPCHGDGPALGGEARRALVRAQDLELDGASALEITPAVNAVCRTALAALITDHLGRPLKTVEFIAKLNHAAAGADS
jgi:DNA repair protein RecO (recombination protein O)